MKTLFRWTIPAALLFSLVLFTGCADDDDDTTGPTPPTPFEQMAEAGDAYLTAGTRNITAENLWTEMNDADATQPYIISIRSFADDTLRGHIPGAVHWDPASLINRRAELPANKKIVIYCYTGQTASFSTSYLRMLGLDAYNLKWGFCSWTADTFETAQGGGWYAMTPGGQQLETTAHPLAQEFTFPNPAVNASDVAGMFAERLNPLLTASPTQWKIKSAPDVYANINDGDVNNDWFLLCYWPEATYNLGHIPGSYCFPPGTLGVSELLKYVPTNKPVVVYCYTGQTSMQVSAYLNALGYDSYSMKFGMNHVTDRDDLLGANKWVDLTPSYPVERGPLDRF